MLCVLSGAASAAVPVGSVVMYSDGRVEKLMSHGNGEWLWEDDRKRQLVRSENPIMPLLRRTDFLSRKGYSQSVGEGDPDSIKQLPSGTRVGFTVVRTRHTGERSTRNWECKHLGIESRKVLGVMRELDLFECERYVIQRKTWQRQFRESRQFSFSRDLGLVVDMQRKTRKKSSNWKLDSVILPVKATYNRLSKRVRNLRGAK